MLLSEYKDTFNQYPKNFDVAGARTAVDILLKLDLINDQLLEKSLIESIELNKNSLRLLNQIALLSEEKYQLGAECLKRLLLLKQYGLAAHLAHYAEYIGVSFLALAIQLDADQTLDFLLTHSSYGINSIMVLLKGQKEPQSLLAAVLSHNKINCFKVLLRHAVNLFQQDERGLPLAYSIAYERAQLETVDSFYESYIRETYLYCSTVFLSKLISSLNKALSYSDKSLRSNIDEALGYFQQELSILQDKPVSLSFKLSIKQRELEKLEQKKSCPAVVLHDAEIHNRLLLVNQQLIMSATQSAASMTSGLREQMPSLEQRDARISLFNNLSVNDQHHLLTLTEKRLNLFSELNLIKEDLSKTRLTVGRRCKAKKLLARQERILQEIREIDSYVVEHENGISHTVVRKKK
jgi:hypothetical protein